MKLLFDQNLSHRLPALLADLFPDSAHVRAATLDQAPDDQIWEYASANDFCIVTPERRVWASKLRCVGRHGLEGWDLGIGREGWRVAGPI